MSARLRCKGFYLLVGFLGLVLLFGGEVAAQQTARLSHNMQVDSPVHHGAVLFAERVEERSGGQLRVEIYPALQLGEMREQTESTQFGSIHFTIQPTAVLSTFAPALGMVDFPFLWPNEDIMWDVLDGEMGQEILATLESRNLRGLVFFTSGLKQVTTAGRAITQPSDFDGLVIRTMPAPLLVAQYEAWGANPVPIEFGELYSALQQGIVDGQENPLETIHMLRMDEVQEHLTVSNHSALHYGFVVNKPWFDGLSPELQEIIREEALNAAKFQRAELAAKEAELLAELESRGMKIHYLDEEAWLQFRDASRGVQEEFGRRIDEDLFRRLVADIESRM